MPGDPPSSAPPNWIDRFKDFMCQLYRSVGGDCQTLAWADGGATAVAAVRSAFDTNGPPAFSSQAEEDEFMAMLNELEAHLQSPDATITQQVSDDVQELIDDFRASINSS